MVKRFLVLYVFSLAFFGCAQKENFKINGVSFVAAPDSLKQKNINFLKEVNPNYTAIMPFGFIKDLNHPEIIFDTNRQWFGETSEGAVQYIKLLHSNKIKVMVKPQIWIWNGAFTGFLSMNSEQDWNALETAYTNFIITYAKLAEQMNAEIFCIGTELEQFIVQRPDYWNKIIIEIKKVYTGRLTYAANWDEYKRVPFWSDLDFIGVDAYFPISESKTPSIEEVKQGWIPWKKDLNEVSKKFNRPILFTEYGYRSVDFSGKEPWDSNHKLSSINFEAQNNLLEGLYQEIWKEPWFQGGFLWKWFIKHDGIGGDNDNQFTPQNKMGEQVVKRYYTQFSKNYR